MQSRVNEIIGYEGDTSLLFAQSAAQGYIIDTQILESFVEQFYHEVEELEFDTKDVIRRQMGWCDLSGDSTGVLKIGAKKKAKVKTLYDLRDGRFDFEPLKRKRIANFDFDTSKKVSKDNPKMWYKVVPDWTLNSRHLLKHIFYNIMGEKTTIKSKLPSIDAQTMRKYKSIEAITLGKAIAKYRSVSKTLASLKLCLSFVRPATQFDSQADKNENRGIIQYNSIGYGCIERLFTRPKESIPINADKRVRKAFIVPQEKKQSLNLSHENFSYLGLGLSVPEFLPSKVWVF